MVYIGITVVYQCVRSFQFQINKKVEYAKSKWILPGDFK